MIAYGTRSTTGRHGFVPPQCLDRKRAPLSECNAADCAILSDGSDGSDGSDALPKLTGSHSTPASVRGCPFADCYFTRG